MILKIGILIFICICFPFLPFFVKNLPRVIYYAIKDVYAYFKYKRWNEFRDYGRIMTYTGLFGAGKTLSCTHYICNIYNHYNGLQVWDFDKGEWVTQHIHIISNYHLKDVPYAKLISEQQLVNIEQPKQDITIIVLDEISAIFNNRDYKNFTPDVLTSLLQCRHRKVAFVGTAQRFQMQDKNFRTTMETSNSCKKRWRFVKISLFDAYELENCPNPTMLKPISIKYWFVKDSDYNAYDTNEMVTKLLKDAELGKMMSSEEITVKQGGSDGDVRLATTRKRKFKKL